MKSFKLVSLLTAALFTLAACNTVQGLGEDIESVGEESEEAIND